MPDRKRLGEEVSLVGVAGFPDNLELALGNAISDPVVAHGCCLEFFYFYFLVCGVIGSGVVGDEYGAVLWIVDAGEDVLQNASSLGHHEHTGIFGFANRGNDVGDDLRGRTYPMVVTIWSFSEPPEAPRSGSGSCF